MKKIKKPKARKEARGWLPQHGGDLGLSAAGSALYEGAKKLYNLASDAIKKSKKPKKRPARKAKSATPTKRPTRKTSATQPRKKPTKKK